MLATRIPPNSSRQVVDRRLNNVEIVTRLESEHFVWQLYVKSKVSVSLKSLLCFVGCFIIENIIVAIELFWEGRVRSYGR